MQDNKQQEGLVSSFSCMQYKTNHLIKLIIISIHYHITPLYTPHI
ncbi:hypothetical protein BRC2024_KCUCJSVR_CDS_0010 [Acinetobacter phage vB_AbaM_KissB]